ncbi:unnamed protein product [Polarella glacialis]|uniref:SAP domain-containing protein n=1 Tax=Polarella glacialis TaxID=89957 RepID=A0A813FLI9_POLGL|nr:unnamed protein product [Polarella glacialis]CAE8623594.1 unnamed protein product [Polarella glacialis]
MSIVSRLSGLKGSKTRRLERYDHLLGTLPSMPILPPYTSGKIERGSVSDLQGVCTKHGLDSSGARLALLARLYFHLIAPQAVTLLDAPALAHRQPCSRTSNHSNTTLKH